MNTSRKKVISEKLKHVEKTRTELVVLSNEQLSRVPDAFHKSKILQASVTALDLSQNQLVTLSDKFARLTLLQTLNLSWNQFRHFPVVLCEMPTLQVLKICGNEISDLPPQFTALTALRELDLSQNQFNQPPALLQHMDSLRTFRWEGNPLDKVYHKMKTCEAGSFQELNLSLCKLERLPWTLPRVAAHLEALVLTGNELEKLEDAIFTLTQLRNLELRDNRISSIPAQITSLSKLEVLGLASNFLSALPLQMRQMEHLTFLNLSKNRFDRMPDVLMNLPHLRELYFNSNQSQRPKLPASIETMKEIEVLRIRDNAIESLDGVDFSKLPKLKSLALSQNPVPDIDFEMIRRCSALTDLDISDTQIPQQMQKILSCYVRKTDELTLTRMKLETLPPECLYVTHITSLRLQFNNLQELPVDIVHLKDIRSLYLSQNQLTTLSEQITTLQYLEELDVSDNPLKDFPSVLFKCHTLNRLKLCRVELSTVPESILQLNDTLSEIDVSGNTLTEQSLATLLRMSRLKVLRANRIGKHTLPSTLDSLQFLEELSFMENGLEQLPASITNLQNLTCLSLQHNSLKKIPKQLLKVKSIYTNNNPLGKLDTALFKVAEEKSTELDLSSLHLCQVPREVLYLSRLQSLNLSQCSFSDDPFSLTSLSSLKSLRVGSNDFTELPLWLRDMKQLTCLDVSNNPLQRLPLWLDDLQNLQELNVSACELSTLPDKASSWSTLEELDCSKNNLRTLNAFFLKSLSSLRILRCNDNQINEFSHILFLGSALEVLEAQNNQLDRLYSEEDKGCISCYKLNYVDVSFNYLTSLPLWLFLECKLDMLKWEGNHCLPAFYGRTGGHWFDPAASSISVDLSFLSLRTVPPQIQLQASAISRLDLCGNNLREFPAVVATHCTNLEYLNVSCNQLTSLSMCCQLVHLQELRAIRNQISEFPTELYTLTKLRFLFLSFNLLTKLPDDLHRFKSLDALHVSDNAVTQVPYVADSANFVLNCRYNPLLPQAPVKPDFNAAPLVARKNTDKDKRMVKHDKDSSKQGDARAVISMAASHLLSSRRKEKSIRTRVTRAAIGHIKGKGSTEAPLSARHADDHLGKKTEFEGSGHARSRSVSDDLEEEELAGSDSPPGDVNLNASVPLEIPSTLSPPVEEQSLSRSWNTGRSRGLSGHSPVGISAYRSPELTPLSSSVHLCNSLHELNEVSYQTHMEDDELVDPHAPPEIKLEPLELTTKPDPPTPPTRPAPSPRSPRKRKSSSKKIARSGVRVYVKCGETTKPIRIQFSTVDELQEKIKERLKLSSDIEQLIVGAGSPVEWEIEEDDDVEELAAGDVITVVLE